MFGSGDVGYIVVTLWAQVLIRAKAPFCFSSFLFIHRADILAHRAQHGEINRAYYAHMHVAEQCH